jgi:hypothetical protein
MRIMKWMKWKKKKRVFQILSSHIQPMHIYISVLLCRLRSTLYITRGGAICTSNVHPFPNVHIKHARLCNSDIFESVEGGIRPMSQFSFRWGDESVWSHHNFKSRKWESPVLIVGTNCVFQFSFISFLFSILPIFFHFFFQATPWKWEGDREDNSIFRKVGTIVVL